MKTKQNKKKLQDYKVI